jgi:heme exporter protein C
MALADAFDDPARGAKAAAILALVGFVNVPIIKFSVDWWNTLHQPASVIKMGGPAIHLSMLAPLLIMVAGFTAYYIAVLIMRMRTEIITAKLRSLQMSRSERQS